MQQELYNNPFGESINLINNIEEGLGIWSGYGALYYDITIEDSMVVYNSVKPTIADLFFKKK